MAPPVRPEPLKQGLHRSVVALTESSGARVVVKRYSSAGALRRLGDGRRARREFAILRELSEAGVPVARPLGLRRSAGAWELECEHLGGLDLESLLEAPLAREDPARARRVARSVGRTLAAAHVAGLDHRDLHLGNLVVDERDDVHLVDFGAARLRGPLAASRLEAAVLSLAAASRERVDRRTRTRALITWWRGLDDALRAEVGSLRPLAERVERAAAPYRARAVERHLDRWTRESGRCRRLDRWSWISRECEDLGEVAVRSLLDGQRARAPHPGDERLELILWTESARAAWMNLARAREHGLPALRPVALRTGPAPRALFSAPRGASPLAGAASAQLAQEVADRALVQEAPNPAWQGPSGEQLLGPSTRLRIAEESRRV